MEQVTFEITKNNGILFFLDQIPVGAISYDDVIIVVGTSADRIERLKIGLTLLYERVPLLRLVVVEMLDELGHSDSRPNDIKAFLEALREASY